MHLSPSNRKNKTSTRPMWSISIKHRFMPHLAHYRQLASISIVRTNKLQLLSSEISSVVCFNDVLKLEQV